MTNHDRAESCGNCRWWHADDTGPVHSIGTCGAVVAAENLNKATLYVPTQGAALELMPYTFAVEESFLSTAADHYCAMWAAKGT